LHIIIFLLLLQQIQLISLQKNEKYMFRLQSAYLSSFFCWCS
jgi:hypothetical protein